MATINYTPPPTVDRFIQSEKFYNFIVGPVGSGKTTGALFKILYHAKLQAPSPQDGIRYTRWVVVRNTRPQLKDTTMRSFFTWFKPNVAGTFHKAEDRFTFRFDDVHAEVLFRPLDTPDDVGRVLSLEVTGAVIDEFVEIPREIVEALGTRCGRYPATLDGGCTWSGMWGASNPGNQDSWWYDWLYEPWPAGEHEGRPKDEIFAHFDQPSGFSPYAENLDNLKGGQQYYTDNAAGKTEEWIKQYIEVKWGYSLRGKPVYSLFNEDIHVSKTPLLFNPALPLIIGMDGGLTPAAVFGQQDLHGRVLILDEVMAENMGAQRFCKDHVLPLLNRRFSDAQEILVSLDPAGGNRSEADENTVKRTIQNTLGVPVSTPHTNLFEPRKEAVDHYLAKLTDVGPAYLIDPRCKVLIRGFANGYRYDINRKGVKDDRPSKNLYSHPHDANQYLCLAFLKHTVHKARERFVQRAITARRRRVGNVYHAR